MRAQLQMPAQLRLREKNNGNPLGWKEIGQIQAELAVFP
jgi:hypothetical protein